jgi:hypothetical protein
MCPACFKFNVSLETYTEQKLEYEFRVCSLTQCSMNYIQYITQAQTKINSTSFLMTYNNILSALTLETLLTTSLIFVNLSISCDYILTLNT